LILTNSPSSFGESNYWFSVPYEIHSTASKKC
jgi:hypothetical protein